MTGAFDLQRFADTAGGDVPADAGSSPSGENGAGGAQNPVGARDPQGMANDASGAAHGDTILGGNAADSMGAGVPDAYDFTSVVPEGMTYDEKAAASFGAVAREAGLTQDQASRVASYGMQYIMQQGVDAAMDMLCAVQEGWAKEAREALGGQFDETVAKAAAGRDALAAKIPNLTVMLNETGAGNRVEMIRLMAAVGELVGEDTGMGGVGAGAGAAKGLYPNTDFRRYGD